MALGKSVFLLLRPHEFELFASVGVVERVDEQIQVIHPLDLPHKLADIIQKLGRVDIVNEIDVELVLSEEPEGFAVMCILYQLDNLLE